VENQDKNVAVLPSEEEGEDRRTWLIEGVSMLDTFAGWGPRMEGSRRNILRGLN
jgi:hypothetical protein